MDKLIDKTEKEYNDLREDLKPKEQEVRKLLDKGKSEQQVSSGPLGASRENKTHNTQNCFLFLCNRRPISCSLEPTPPKLWPRRRRRRARRRSRRLRTSWTTSEVPERSPFTGFCPCCVIGPFKTR